jgi:hypothetical protein
MIDGEFPLQLLLQAPFAWTKQWYPVGSLLELEEGRPHQVTVLGGWSVDYPSGFIGGFRFIGFTYVSHLCHGLILLRTGKYSCLLARMVRLKAATRMLVSGHKLLF